MRERKAHLNLILPEIEIVSTIFMKLYSLNDRQTQISSKQQPHTNLYNRDFCEIYIRSNINNNPS